MSPTAVLQLDLLDLLAEPEPEALDRDTDVLGCYLGPRRLHQIVRALNNPARLKDVRTEIVSVQSGGFGPHYRWQTEPTGLHVLRWYDQPDPWIITWPAAFRLIRQRAAPDRAEALHAARRANSTTQASPAEYAAAHAILPNRWTSLWAAS